MVAMAVMAVAAAMTSALGALNGAPVRATHQAVVQTAIVNAVTNKPNELAAA